MAQANSFNINELYRKVFGITGVRFAIPDSPKASNIAGALIAASTYKAGEAAFGLSDAIGNALNAPGYFDPAQLQTIPLPASSIQSVLGTPIYEQIAITIPAVVSNGVVTAKQKIYTMLDWPLFDITGQNIIENTTMTKKRGSVKEFITEDDYTITIRGLLINYETQEYPEQQLQDFMQIINAKTTLGITSQVFNLLDIHNIVIKSWSLPGVEGYQNIQPFQLECLSDEPVELEIKSVKTQKAIIPGL